MKDTHGGFGGLFALVAVNSKVSIHNLKLSFTHRFSLITRHCLSPLIAHGLPVRVARRRAFHSSLHLARLSKSPRPILSGRVPRPFGLKGTVARSPKGDAAISLSPRHRADKHIMTRQSGTGNVGVPAYGHGHLVPFLPGGGGDSSLCELRERSPFSRAVLPGTNTVLT